MKDVKITQQYVLERETKAPHDTCSDKCLQSAIKSTVGQEHEVLCCMRNTMYSYLAEKKLCITWEERIKSWSSS